MSIRVYTFVSPQNQVQYVFCSYMKPVVGEAGLALRGDFSDHCISVFIMYLGTLLNAIFIKLSSLILC